MPSKNIFILGNFEEFFLSNLFRLVLRIVTDDVNAVCRFSMKFGADMITARKLVDKAQEIDMEIIGVR